MRAVDGDGSNDGGREDLVSEGLLKIREAAEFLKLSRSRLYELMDAGELAYVKIGRSRRVPRRGGRRAGRAKSGGRPQDVAPMTS